MTTENPNLARLLDAVEQAWEMYPVRTGVLHHVRELLAAHCAAREAGMVPVMVSRDTMKWARKLNTPGPIETEEYEHAKVQLCARLLDDLAAVLKDKS